MTPDARQPLVVVMGVSGCGKSTVAEQLAARAGIRFADADDFHPAANVEKMAAGIALTDDDRAPWLRTLAGWLAAQHETGASLACSALRHSYRDSLRHGNPELFFVHLHGCREVIAARVSNRSGHFMPATLLDSQFATLEPLGAEEAGVVLDIDQPVAAQVEQAASAIDAHLRRPSRSA